MTARRGQARVLRDLAEARLMAMTPEQIAPMDNRVLAAVTHARWTEAKRLLALRRRIASLSPVENKTLTDWLDSFAAGPDRCEEEGASAERMKQRRQQLPAPNRATEE